MSHGIRAAHLRQAAERIAPHVHRTPVFRCSSLDQRAGRELHFKAEQLQRAGAFKFRGACNAIFSLSESEAARGVLTHSSGNHAQALALAAKRRGIPAHVVMPRNASAVKRAAVLHYGANVVECEPTLKAREETAQALGAETGALFIHPYDDPRIICGQATAAQELLQDVPDLDAIVVPVGGGGLLSGTCLAASAAKPSPLVIAAEPRGADDAARSLAAGELIPQTDPNTFCDGLLTSLGSLTWPIIRDHVAGIVTVADDATVEAMRLLWQRAKLLVECNSAVALAALLDEGFSRRFSKLKRIGVILSGGNVDLDALPWYRHEWHRDEESAEIDGHQ